MDVETYRLKRIINEELSKSDVQSMINSKLDSFLRERELKKTIREVAVDVLDDFFKELWHKRGFWCNPLKNK